MPRPLVRHFSWYASGKGGFSASLESGQEIASPFALIVSKRMAEHRSGTNSPLAATEPLTEEELEDILSSDPEMGASTGPEQDTDMDDRDPLLDDSFGKVTHGGWQDRMMTADWVP